VSLSPPARSAAHSTADPFVSSDFRYALSGLGRCWRPRGRYPIKTADECVKTEGLLKSWIDFF